MKCLPQTKLQSAGGNVLHDWHAEVLAIRAFNRFLVDECAELAQRGLGGESAWVRWRRRVDDEVEPKRLNELQQDNEAGAVPSKDGAPWQEQPFELHEDVCIDMYVSDAPCGDASMELVMAEQDDATPWENVADGMPGRGNFDRLGVVRRKPARPDAPATVSKSCSDKLALKQCTSLLSGPTSLLVCPERCYLRRLVLPFERCVPTATQRAFGKDGRMKPVTGADLQSKWEQDGYSFKPFEVATTSRRFAYEKTPGAAASNISVFATPYRREVLINGVLQGRKQFDPKGASSVSRRKMLHGIAGILDEIGQQDSALSDLLGKLGEQTHAWLKSEAMFLGRQAVKEDVRTLALKGWERNVGDGDWSLDHEAHAGA